MAGKLSRHEFMDLCVTIMWDQPLSQLREAATNYAECVRQDSNQRLRSPPSLAHS